MSLTERFCGTPEFKLLSEVKPEDVKRGYVVGIRVAQVNPEDVKRGYAIAIRPGEGLILAKVRDCNETCFSYQAGDRRDGIFVDGSMLYDGPKHPGVLIQAGMRRTRLMLAHPKLAARVGGKAC